VRLEGLGQLEISNDVIGNQTRCLPVCSIVSQATEDRTLHPKQEDLKVDK
jgi:hypothetical protein